MKGLSALGKVVLIQAQHGFADVDTFRSDGGGWILSKPMSTVTWFVSAEGRIRQGTLSNWRDFEVRDI